MDFQSQIALDAGRTYAADAPVSERLVFLRKTYLLTLLGLGMSALGGWAGATTLLPFVLRAFQGFVGLIVFLVLFYGGFAFAKSVRAKPGLNYFAMFLFTFIAGLTIGPLLFLATRMAGGQPTLILQAVVVSGVAITGLSGYVLVTRKDFSFLRGALTIGVFVLLGLILVTWIFGVASFGMELLISAGGAVLISGFVLYDTSRIVRNHPTNDAVGAALDLFLDFFILFIYILRLLMLLAANRD